MRSYAFMPVSCIDTASQIRQDPDYGRTICRSAPVNLMFEASQIPIRRAMPAYECGYVIRFYALTVQCHQFCLARSAVDCLPTYHMNNLNMSTKSDAWYTIRKVQISTLVGEPSDPNARSPRPQQAPLYISFQCPQQSASRLLCISAVCKICTSLALLMTQVAPDSVLTCAYCSD